MDHDRQTGEVGEAFTQGNKEIFSLLLMMEN